MEKRLFLLHSNKDNEANRVPNLHQAILRALISLIAVKEMTSSKKSYRNSAGKPENGIRNEFRKLGENPSDFIRIHPWHGIC